MAKSKSNLGVVGDVSPVDLCSAKWKIESSDSWNWKLNTVAYRLVCVVLLALSQNDTNVSRILTACEVINCCQ